MNNLPPNALMKLGAFVGYGNPHKTISFLGLEEGLNKRSPTSILSQLLTRIEKFEEIEDCRRATEMLGVGHFHDNVNPKLQSTWRWMSSIMTGLDGGNYQSEDVLVKYQRDHLGRHGGNTLLTELFPLPKSRFHAWPDVYKQWFGYSDAATYRPARF